MPTRTHTPPTLLRLAPLWPAAFLSLLGCPNQELAAIAPCTVSGVFDKITQSGPDEVDLLFMVDNSSSMKEEQENLARNLPALVEILASGQVKDKDGKVIQTFPAVSSLHLGVISSNLGINGVPTAPGHSCAGSGDDGKLLHVPTDATIVADPACKRAFPPYLEFPSENLLPSELGASFGCISRTGANGCGFEQQLEATWKALAPSDDTSFSGGSAGHGDDTGFLRKDSIVALVLVSDEEDSSIPDASRALFDISDETTSDTMRTNLRQYLHPEMLHNTDRYVKGFRSLRPDNPELVIFAAIVGVPLEAENLEKNGVQDFDAILKLRKMRFREAPPEADGRILPDSSCHNVNGVAYPGPRFVEVAKGFGSNGIVRSICNEDFSGALTAIIKKIAVQLQGACLKRKLIADPATGLAPCGLVEYLRLGAQASDCVTAKGRRFVGMRLDDEGKEHVVCQLNQLKVEKGKAGCDANGESTPEDCLAPNPNSPDASENPRITPSVVGWYYDDFSKELKDSPPDCNSQRIAFTSGAEQQKGSEVRFECLQPVFSVFADPKGVDAVNKPCLDSPKICAKAMNEEYPSGLICDAKRATCQLPCSEDANCPDGWVCAKETGESGGICLNPTCPPQ